MARSASPCPGRALGAWVDKVLAEGLGGATEFAGKGFRPNHYRFAPLSATGWSAALRARRRWWLCEKGLQCATNIRQVSCVWRKTSRKGLVQQDSFATRLGMSAKGRERPLGEMKGGIGMWITFAVTLTNLQPSSASLRYTQSQPR